MNKRRLALKFYKQNRSRKICSICKKNYAEYMYMPDVKNRYYCYNCVPKGCSCNAEHIIDKKTRDAILKEIEEYIIFDRKTKKYIRNQIEIKKITQNINIDEENKNPRYDFLELDEKGNLYPCVEFWYDKNNFRV